MRLKVLVISPHKADPPRWTEAESHVINTDLSESCNTVYLRAESYNMVYLRAVTL